MPDPRDDSSEAEEMLEGAWDKMSEALEAQGSTRYEIRGAAVNLLAALARYFPNGKVGYDDEQL